MYRVEQTELDKMIRRANPDVESLTATGATDVSLFREGGKIPVFKYPSGAVKPAQEQYQFLTGGAQGKLGFADSSAFGFQPVKGNSGLVVYADDYARLEVPGAPHSKATPLGTKFFEGRELEIGHASGKYSAPFRDVGSMGYGDHRLFLDERLMAPGYLSRVRGNVKAAVKSWGQPERQEYVKIDVPMVWWGFWAGGCFWAYVDGCYRPAAGAPGAV